MAKIQGTADLPLTYARYPLRSPEGCILFLESHGTFLLFDGDLSRRQHPDAAVLDCSCCVGIGVLRMAAALADEQGLGLSVVRVSVRAFRTLLRRAMRRYGDNEFIPPLGLVDREHPDRAPGGFEYGFIEA